MNTKRFYNPYMGSNFEKGSGLLILSESAYGWEEDGGGLPKPNHPSEHTVKKWALDDFENRGKRARYIAWLTRALCRNEEPNRQQREQAWSKVAYSIYVQRPMENLTERPIEEDFARGREAFLELIEELRPGRVLITSIGSWDAMPHIPLNQMKDERCGAYRLEDGTLCWCLAVPHQRARRMGWERLGDCIDAFCAEDLSLRLYPPVFSGNSGLCETIDFVDNRGG